MLWRIDYHFGKSRAVLDLWRVVGWLCAFAKIFLASIPVKTKVRERERETEKRAQQFELNPGWPLWMRRCPCVEDNLGGNNFHWISLPFALFKRPLKPSYCVPPLHRRAEREKGILRMQQSLTTIYQVCKEISPNSLQFLSYIFTNLSNSFEHRETLHGPFLARGRNRSTYLGRSPPLSR